MGPEESPAQAGVKLDMGPAAIRAEGDASREALD